MKKNYLEKIKLNKFGNAELEQRKLNALKGGCSCTIGCSNCGNCPYSPLTDPGEGLGLLIGTTWAPHNMGSGSTKY